jgi:hypothetical protein
MKQLISFVFILSSCILSAQSNFHWDVIDSVAKTKAAIYSDTKLFIAETWNSAQNVIQNDDKEGGVILLKGIAKVSSTFQMNVHEYAYGYTVKLYQKEGKFRIVIENVHCESARCAGYEWPKVEPTEDYSQNVGGVPAKKLEPMMLELKAHLQSIVDSYLVKIKKVDAEEGKW